MWVSKKKISDLIGNADYLDTLYCRDYEWIGLEHAFLAMCDRLKHYRTSTEEPKLTSEAGSIIKLEKRVEQLECEHDEWEYEISCDNFPYVMIAHYKKCGKCGKKFFKTHDEWLQEQADYHYERHEHFINQINMLDAE